MKNINTLFNFRNVFTDDANFNTELLKFERTVSFDDRDFAAGRKRSVLRQMEKILLEITRHNADIERCAIKIQDSVKKIEMNNDEIRGALRNSNINWRSYFGSRRFNGPTTTIT